MKVCQQEGASKGALDEKSLEGSQPSVVSRTPQTPRRALGLVIACQSLMAKMPMPCRSGSASFFLHGPWGDVPQSTLSALCVFLNTVIQKPRVGGALAISDMARQHLRPGPWTDESTTDNSCRELHYCAVDRAISKRHQMASRRVDPSLAKQGLKGLLHKSISANFSELPAPRCHLFSVSTVSHGTLGSLEEFA